MVVIACGVGGGFCTNLLYIIFILFNERRCEIMAVVRSTRESEADIVSDVSLIP